MQSLLQMLSTKGPFALLILRVVTGVILAVHGYQKATMYGWGIGFFHSLGIPLAQVVGPVVTVLEIGGGVLLILGLFVRLLGLVFTIEFIVAFLLMLSSKGLAGRELEALMLVASLVLATEGAGAISLGRARGLGV